MCVRKWNVDLSKRFKEAKKEAKVWYYSKEKLISRIAEVFFVTMIED